MLIITNNQPSKVTKEKKSATCPDFVISGLKIIYRYLFGNKFVNLLI